MLRIAYLLLGSLGFTSCTMLHFVGGRPSLEAYPLEASYAHALRATDSLVTPTGNLRRLRDGSGYDAGSHRKLYLVTQDIHFSVRFRGDSTDWNDRPGTSQLSVNFVEAGGASFNGGVKRTPAEKAQLAAAIRTLETAFVEPLRRAMR